MIFVTVGSQKFQMDRLVRAADALARGGWDVFVQYGHSMAPEYADGQQFLPRDEMVRRMRGADAVITHGGTGTLIDCIRMGKVTIAVPRLRKFGEHVDGHQAEIVGKLADAGAVMAAGEDLGCLDGMLRCGFEPAPYVLGNGALIGDLRTYLAGAGTC